AGAHAGTDVGGASGQVAQLLAERIIDAILQHVVNAVDVLPSFVQSEAAAHDLLADVVLLIDHHADAFAFVEGDATRPLGTCQLPADKLALDKELAVERR